MQTTLSQAVAFRGVGLHSGQISHMRVLPASANYGVWFKRVDVLDRDNMIPVLWENGVPSPLCTVLRNEVGVDVRTVEHILAALAGCGIHNALIEIDSPEVPIMDGSSAKFVSQLFKVGLQELSAPVRVIEILKPVEFLADDGSDGYARLMPCDGFEIDVKISFVDKAIGTQALNMNMANGAFVRELSDCRTFCRESDVQAMRKAGLALGGTYDNAVVVSGDKVLSPTGLRRKDEAVRHKILDALGDLSLAGGVIKGRYEGYRSGHAMTNKLLCQLFNTTDAWRIIECDHDMRRHLPGVGVKMTDLPLTA